MSWEASPQDYAGILVLLILYIWMDKGVRPAMEIEIIEITSVGKIGEGRVKLAISDLLKRNLIEVSSPNEPSEYRISSEGAHWMEDNFKIEKGAKYHFIPKSKGISPRDLDARISRSGLLPYVGTNAINWSKWGTVLTGLGVVVAIVLWMLP